MKNLSELFASAQVVDVQQAEEGCSKIFIEAIDNPDVLSIIVIVPTTALANYGLDNFKFKIPSTG